MAEPARSQALPAASDGHTWPAQGAWTYEDYVRLPDDGKRYEVIRGVLYVSPAPVLLHEYCRNELREIMGRLIREKRLGFLLASPLDVRLPRRIGDPVQPDLVYIPVAKQPRWEVDSSFDGVPDLVVEILSPSTTRLDRRIKHLVYQEAGILEYWIVDPRARTIEVFGLSADSARYDELCRGGEGDVVRSVVLPGLEVSVSEIFPPRS
ncbi:MAG TPA: Uma2 family endonuclease [Thermoanaerobaculia bacterium]|nr:Uma2 family endonuclease [Thermoanaerobaculia bacterium]